MNRRLKSLFMGVVASAIMVVVVAVLHSLIGTTLSTSQLTQIANELFVEPTVTPSTVVLGDSIQQQSDEAIASRSGESVGPLRGEMAAVKRVVDGDTIELTDGRTLRYIGIDTPESKKPNTSVQCFALAASARNKELVEGKTVRLVNDVSETDRYKRLLRYVYVDDQLVNEVLVREGYAFARSYPPDIALQEQLRAAETKAREESKGLWGSCNVQEKGKKGEWVIK